MVAHIRYERWGCAAGVRATAPTLPPTPPPGVASSHVSQRTVSSCVLPASMRRAPLARQPASCPLLARRDEDEAEEAAGSMQEYEGHLVAHIKVPPTYFDAQQQSPAGGTPHALSRAPSDADVGPAGSATGGRDAAGGVTPSAGSAPHTPSVAAASALEIASLMLPGSAAAGSALAEAALSPGTAASWGVAVASQQARTQQAQQGRAEGQQDVQGDQQQQQQLGKPPGQPPRQVEPQQPGLQAQQPELSSSDAEAIRQASNTLVAAMSGTHSAHSTPPYRWGRHALGTPRCWPQKRGAWDLEEPVAPYRLSNHKWLSVRLPQRCALLLCL